MNHPIIGISGSHNVADRQMFVRENYMQSVLRAGGIPVLLPEVEDEATAKAMIDHLDGLLHILTCFIMNRDNISTAARYLRASDYPHGDCTQHAGFRYLPWHSGAQCCDGRHTDSRY